MFFYTPLPPPASKHIPGRPGPSMPKVSEGMGVSFDWVSFQKVLPGGWELYLEKHYAAQSMEVPEYLRPQSMRRYSSQAQVALDRVRLQGAGGGMLHDV